MDRQRKSVSVRQLELLVEYMERHPDLALGHDRSKESRALSKKLWAHIALTLNSKAKRGNSLRTPIEWNKFYNDFKCRTRRKYASIISGRSRLGHIVTLTRLEERLLNILGVDVGVLPAQDPDPAYVEFVETTSPDSEEEEIVDTETSRTEADSLNATVSATLKKAEAIVMMAQAQNRIAAALEQIGAGVWAFVKQNRKRETLDPSESDNDKYS